MMQSGRSQHKTLILFNSGYVAFWEKENCRAEEKISGSQELGLWGEHLLQRELLVVAAVFSVLVGMVVSDVKTQQTVVFFFFFLIYFSYAISVYGTQA